MKRHLLFFAVLLLLLTGCNNGDTDAPGANPAGATPQTDEAQAPSGMPTVIDVDVASVEGNQTVVLGDLAIGMGDTVSYNIAYTGDGNVQVGFVVAGQDPNDPDTRSYLSLSSFGGGDLKSSVTSELVGMYSLYVRTLSEDGIQNVTGTVVISPV